MGLFANSPVISVFVDWPEAERVRLLAREITAMHNTFGSANPVCELFLHYCSLRGGHNIRGEPKLAAEFLEELADAKPTTETSFGSAQDRLRHEERQEANQDLKTKETEH